VTTVESQEKKLNTRYEITVDQDAFSQKTPKEALTSVLKAIQAKKIDYLVAQLSDPAWVDQLIKEEHKGSFDGMVKEVTTKLLDDSDTVAQLRRFIKDGEWEDGEDTASAKLKDSKDRVFLRKLEGRWFLENRKEGKK
jgi:hypothetical protein